MFIFGIVIINIITIIIMIVHLIRKEVSYSQSEKVND